MLDSFYPAEPLLQFIREQGVTVIHATPGTSNVLAGQTGAVFRADACTYCHDGYHPSADGYRVWAHALLPAVSEAATVPR